MITLLCSLILLIGDKCRDTQKVAKLKAYKKARRWIVCIHGPWIDLNEAFRRGLAEDGFFDLEAADDDEEERYVGDFYAYMYIFMSISRDEADQDIANHLQLYRSVLALVPNFKKSLEEFGDDFESIMELISLVSRVFMSSAFRRLALDGTRVTKCPPARYEQDEGVYSRLLHILRRARSPKSATSSAEG